MRIISWAVIIIIIIIIIIITERNDLGGVMSKDCKDTLHTLKTVTKRECDAKWEQSICQMWSVEPHVFYSGLFVTVITFWH